MLFEKSTLYLFLMALSVFQCSGPRASQSASDITRDSSENLVKINMTDLEGRPLSVKDFAGKPVFLNFWATWCGPCKSEMQSIEKVSQQFKNDIVFLAVSNESPSIIRSYLKNYAYSFRFAHLEGSYLDVYVVALPTTFLIDGNGQLVEEEEGFRDWMDPSSVQKLKSLLKH